VVAQARHRVAVIQRRDAVEVNGARLAFEIAGHGRPLVLIHAGIADSRMWDDQVDAFARQFTVIRYNLRGFGQSVMPAGTYSDRDDLCGLLRALDIVRAAVVGVSRGAMIALDFALDHPKMVEALVLTSPALGGVAASVAAHQQDAGIGALADSGDLAGAVELELRRWVDGPHRSPDMVDAIVRETVRAMDIDNFNLEEDGDELPLMPPAAGRLVEIRVPTLVIVGDGDVPEILENADRLVGGITGSGKAVVPNAAHMLSMERTQEFNRLVLDFLRGL